MKKLRSSVVWRIVVFAVIVLAYLLFPNGNNYAHPSFWMNRILGNTPIIFVSIRLFVLAPLSWCTLVFALTGCLDRWLIKHGLTVQWSEKRCRILFVIAVVLVLPLAYWTYGFVHYAVLRPLPFEIGYYVMNHRSILSLCWAAVAILLQLSLFGIEIKTE